MFLPGFVAGVTGFLFGWVILGDIAAEFASGPEQEHAGFPAAMRNLIGMLMAVLTFGTLVARAGARRRILSFMKGFTSSLFIGFLIYSSVELIFPVMSVESLSGSFILEVLLKSAFAGVMGAFAANVLYLLRDPIERNMFWGSAQRTSVIDPATSRRSW